jgi:hypothetical protein
MSVLFSMVAAMLGCGGGSSDGDADGDADADADTDADADADADGDCTEGAPLRVDFRWTTFCPEGGCGDEHNEIVGEAGAEVTNGPGSTIGLACDLLPSDDGSVSIARLQVQNEPLEAQATEGIRLTEAVLSPKGASCPEDAFVLFDEGLSYAGGCGGLADGDCIILLNESDPAAGCLTLEISCRLLAGSRDLQNGRLTVEGCSR